MITEAVHPQCKVSAFSNTNCFITENVKNPIIRYANESMFECVSGGKFNWVEYSCPVLVLTPSKNG